MKTITAVLIALSFLNLSQARAQGGAMGGGGGDFNHMRQLEALSRSDFQRILQDKGSHFMSSVVSPVAWVGHQYLLDSRLTRTQPSSAITWNTLLAQGYESLWNRINQTSLEDCSCSGVVEPESSNNQICSMPAMLNQPAKICMDLSKIFDANRPMNVDYHSLLGAIWHELAHLYAPSVPHQQIYQFGNKVKNQSIVNGFRTAYDLKPQSQKCTLNGNDFPSTTFRECVSQAILLSQTGSVKIKYKTINPNVEYKGYLEQPLVADAHFTCQLFARNPQFPNQLLTEKTEDFYSDNSAFMSDFSSFQKETPVGQLSYTIYMGTLKDASVWTVTTKMKEWENCLYAFEQGFDKVTITGSAGKFLKLQ